MSKPLSEMSLEELWSLFPIKLVEHNPDWKEWYKEEEKLLVESISKSNIERISHIGSTSIEGLIAKPTIDILLEITDSCNLNHLVENVEKVGYILEKQLNKPAPHMMFMKGYTENGFDDKVFHLHIRYKGDWDELYFRDYLINHKEIAKEYAQLKLSLKEKYEHNRDAYTDAKTEFVKKYSSIGKESFK
jgi:GrpB-like predicted nucleotidyltransferase (UPF0157 family)|nr:GrpB family protein [Heyndrickxia oleronia]